MLAVSAKLGTGVTQLLDSVVERVPPPATRGPEADMRLLLFDSWYDRYHGTINLVQVRTRGHFITTFNFKHPTSIRWWTVC